LKCLWEGIKTTSFDEFCKKKEAESGSSGASRNNIFYLNIFYFECLWEGFKTLSFAHKMKESGLAGVERKNVFEYFFLKCLWEGLKTPSFASKIEESRLSGVCRNSII
jgi:hypothetical protein